MKSGPKFIDKPMDEKRLGPQHCKTCGKATRERKPYCPEHIMEMAYPASRRAMLDKTEEELKKVSKVGAKAVNLEGLVVEEIMCNLAQVGRRTWRRLCKERVFFFNDTDTDTADAYLLRLKRAGYVDVWKSSRNVDVVAITPKGLVFTQERRSPQPEGA